MIYLRKDINNVKKSLVFRLGFIFLHFIRVPVGNVCLILKTMKKTFLLLAAIFAAMCSFAQLSPETIAKRERHKNLVIREMNTDNKGNNGWLDHVTTYDDQGRKIEEIEYATYGMRERTVFFYEDETVGKVTKEVCYDARNKPYRVRKYEYNADGTKKIQYNYLPSGKLYSIKKFEYSFVEATTK